ncbi:MAG: hypothetical protein HIU89_09730 [Proteobacteria bacterium]|nr:hypothetical protein [Pseudomonadota bacterium]
MRWPEPTAKVEAVKQVTERGYALTEVAARLRVSAWSPHRWIKERSQLPGKRQEVSRVDAEST